MFMLYGIWVSQRFYFNQLKIQSFIWFTVEKDSDSIAKVLDDIFQSMPARVFIPYLCSDAAAVMKAAQTKVGLDVQTTCLIHALQCTIQDSIKEDAATRKFLDDDQSIVKCLRNHGALREFIFAHQRGKTKEQYIKNFQPNTEIRWDSEFQLISSVYELMEPLAAAVKDENLISKGYCDFSNVELNYNFGLQMTGYLRLFDMFYKTVRQLNVECN